MATLINGSKIEQCGYEFGVNEGDGEVIVCRGYDVAKRIAEANDGYTVKMRCLYRTDWQEGM